MADIIDKIRALQRPKYGGKGRATPTEEIHIKKCPVLFERVHQRFRFGTRLRQVPSGVRHHEHSKPRASRFWTNTAAQIAQHDLAPQCEALAPGHLPKQGEFPRHIDEFAVVRQQERAGAQRL